MPFPTKPNIMSLTSFMQAKEEKRQVKAIKHKKKEILIINSEETLEKAKKMLKNHCVLSVDIEGHLRRRGYVEIV